MGSSSLVALRRLLNGGSWRERLHQLKKSASANWRREDYAYAVAAALAALLVAYVVAGNFGLVPSPIGAGGPGRAAQPQVAVFADATPNPTPRVAVAALVVRPANGARPRRPAPRRHIPPTIAFTTSSGTTVSAAQPGQVEGVAESVDSGVKSVLVTFRESGGATTEIASTVCRDAHRTCAWAAVVPGVVGTYDVGASAFDAAGLSGHATPITITVVNGGGPVGQVVAVVAKVPVVLVNVLDRVLGLLPHL